MDQLGQPVPSNPGMAEEWLPDELSRHQRPPAPPHVALLPGSKRRCRGGLCRSGSPDHPCLGDIQPGQSCRFLEGLQRLSLLYFPRFTTLSNKVFLPTPKTILSSANSILSHVALCEQQESVFNILP